jgi:sugar (pentulose or hexulose) kinase
VFGATVHVLDVGNSAALGAALRAWHAHERAIGNEPGWDDIVAPFVRPDPSRAIHPRAEYGPVYAELMQRYADREAQALNTENV